MMQSTENRISILSPIKEFTAMTPKHVFSVDHKLFEILPSGTANNLEELAGAAFDSVECANRLANIQDQCHLKNVASEVPNHGNMCSEGGYLNYERNNSSLNDVTDGIQDSKDTTLCSCDVCSNSLVLQKIDLDKVKDATESTDTLRAPDYISANKQCLFLTCSAESGLATKCGVTENVVPNACKYVNTCCKPVLNIFDSLPLEIQHKILSYLSTSELCLCVAPVCKRWHDLAYEPILWQQLTFRHSVPLDAVKKILERSTLVRYLSLFGFREVNVFLPQLLNCHFLLCLDLKMCGGLGGCHISQLVQQCPLIEYLNVEGCRNIDDVAVTEIIEWKRMRCLNLSHCNCVQDVGVILIAQELNLLQELNIDGIENISDAAVTIVIDRRKGTLQKLLLDGEDLTDVTYRSLSSCSGLKELCVSFAVLMSDQGLVAIKELTALRNLKIKRGSELTESGLQALFESQNLCQLTSLDLSGCSNLEDTGVDAMTKCCSRLKFLGLEWCWDISEKGLEMIVTRCSCLKEMNLVGLVKITGSCFSKIPECMPQLIYLDLQQCSRIIDDIVEDVVRRKPDLKVLDYYGEELHTETSGDARTLSADELTDVCVCSGKLHPEF